MDLIHGDGAIWAVSPMQTGTGSDGQILFA
jgi:hypothetical protein